MIIISINNNLKTMGYYYTAVIKEGKIISVQLKSDLEGAIGILPHKAQIEYSDCEFTYLICQRISGEGEPHSYINDYLKVGVTEGIFTKVTMENFRSDFQVQIDSKEIVVTYPGNIKYRIYTSEEYDDDFEDNDAEHI